MSSIICIRAAVPSQNAHFSPLSSSPAALKELETEVYDSCLDWLSNLPEHYKDQIQHHFGQFPEREADVQASPCGPTWVWWAVAVLPLDRQVRMLMLAMRSFRERLVAIRRMVSYLNRKKQQSK